MSETPKPSKVEIPLRVIFADFANVKYNGIIQKLSDDGVLTETVTGLAPLMEKISTEIYDLCVFNLLLGGLGPFEMIATLRNNSRNPLIKMIVVSRQIHKANIQNS